MIKKTYYKSLFHHQNGHSIFEKKTLIYGNRCAQWRVYFIQARAYNLVLGRDGLVSGNKKNHSRSLVEYF